MVATPVLQLMEARLAGLVERLERAVASLEPRLGSSELVDRVENIVQKLEGKVVSTTSTSSGVASAQPQSSAPSSAASFEDSLYESNVLAKLDELRVFAERTGSEGIQKLV